MKSRTLMCTVALVALTLFAALAIPVRQAAQQEQQQNNQLPRYTVTDLGTLGGMFSFAQGVNNKGWVDGAATLPGDNNQHEFLWVDGLKIDLGTLGGPNSGPSFFFGGLNERGAVPGAAETSSPDPLGEDFCGFGTHLICVPSIWQNGVWTPLPTLGGSNGITWTTNNLGQVTGRAENATPDPTCPAPQVLQAKPVLWENGEIQELPTVSGDPDGLAFGINDHGQAVGASGICLVFNSSFLHALLWQNGAVTDLGNLGGTMNNLSLDINNRGQAVGASDLPGDTTTHAFLWEKGAMTDLGTLPGMTIYSQGNAINDNGQVVGISCGESGCLAFLWQNGVMTDLNALIPAGSPLVLCEAAGINSHGAIAGVGFEPSIGELHAFLATPSEGEAASESGAPVARPETGERPKLILPENVRKLLQQRLRFGGLGPRLMRP